MSKLSTLFSSPSLTVHHLLQTYTPTKDNAKVKREIRKTRSTYLKLKLRPSHPRLLLIKETKKRNIKQTEKRIILEFFQTSNLSKEKSSHTLTVSAQSESGEGREEGGNFSRRLQARSRFCGPLLGDVGCRCLRRSRL